MVLFTLSIILWILSLGVAVRLFIMGRESWMGKKIAAVVWCLLLVGTGVLFFRPHEDIFGGEDPGSYVNSAMSYAREGAFFKTDQLLCRVPVDARRHFLYGHKQYGETKDACLWVRDMENAVVGPHFLPAYPLLMAGVAAAGPDFAILLVVPLFGIFTAIALRALASKLFDFPWAGMLAYLVFVSMPLLVWHVRQPRPEIVAAFMFLGGFAMILNAWRHPRWTRWYDVALGALCISCAPFFHVKAAMLVAPTAVIVVCMILAGRDDFLPFPIIGYVMLTIFAAQARFITNYYHVDAFLGFVLDWWFVCLPVFLAALGGLFWGGRRLSVRAFLSDSIGSPMRKGRIRLVNCCFAGVTTLLLLVLIIFRNSLGGRAVIEHYLYVVDMRSVLSSFSWPVVLLALFGWFMMTMAVRQSWLRTLAFGAAVFPAMVFAGCMNDFMMTRYMLIAIVPVFALSLTALLMPLNGANPGKGLITSVVFLLAITPLLMNNRTHLVAEREHAGFVRFLKPFADYIKEKNGYLLCEYSRLAAPFEHYFGVPTLGLDAERRFDYSRAEKAWERILLSSPNATLFYATPFQPPISDRFVFKPEMDAVFDDAKIKQAKHALPVEMRNGTIDLKLYSMVSGLCGKTPEARPPDDGFEFPHVIVPGRGNMGLKNFSKTRQRDWSVDGFVLDPYLKVKIRKPAGKVDSLLVFIRSSYRNPEAPVFLGDCDANQRIEIWKHLFDGWWLYGVSGSPLQINGDLSITSRTPAILSRGVFLDGPEMRRAKVEPCELGATEQSVSGMSARWTRAHSELLVPLPVGKNGSVVMFVWMPRTGDEDTAGFSVACDAFTEVMHRTVPVERWEWVVIPYEKKKTAPGKAWLRLDADRTWNSGLDGFPSDLGILLSAVVMIPEEPLLRETPDRRIPSNP